MPIPLPDEIVAKGPETAPNLSLTFYKRADVYESNSFKKTITEKTSFFSKLIELSTKPDYVNAFMIRKQLIDGVGVAIDMTTASRLVCGMGYEHPLENGFMFDWTTGLPLIPGSSLKGAALRAAEEIRDHGTDDEMRLLFETTNQETINNSIDQIFGRKDGSGAVVFFTAHPCLNDDQKFLELDVITPHYQQYYSNPDKPNEYPPADWYSPVPIHFLTVPAGVKYCFRLANRKNLKDSTSGLLKIASRILCHALTESGVGAKTNVFYGYFK
ncbi:MAG: type III-B CRISPR module RAMP protein Cmr6 [Nitrospirota bacterium]